MKWATLTLLAVLIVAVASCNTAEEDSPDDALYRGSDEDNARISEIIDHTIEDEEYLTPKVHAEFWELLEKADLTNREIREARDFLTEVASTYQQLFWADALIAFETEIPQKSDEREEYEEYLQSIGVMDSSQIDENDAFMRGIASRYTTVGTSSQLVRIDKAAIHAAAENADLIANRLELLFERPPTN